MIWSYAWKGFVRRKSRAVLAISGLGISIAMLVAVATISRAVRGAVGASLAATGADMVIQREVPACPWAQVKLVKHLGAVDASVMEAVKDLEGVENVAGVLELWAFAESDPGADRKALQPTVVAGVDPRKKSIGPVRVQDNGGEDDKSCCAVTSGRYLIPTDDFHVMLTEQYAQLKNLKIGDSVTLGPYTFEVVAHLDFGEGARIAGAEAFIPLKTAQTMYDGGEVLTKIFVDLERQSAFKAVEETATELIGPQARATTETNIDEATGAVASVTQSTLLAVSAIVLTLVLLLVAKTALSSVAERVSEIGILKATGWRDGDVSRLLTAESLYAGIIGGFLGTVVGVALAFLYGRVAVPKLPASLVSYPDCAETPPPIALPISAMPEAGLVIGAIVVALLIGCMSGYLASRRAAKLDPAAALRQL